MRPVPRRVYWVLAVVLGLPAAALVASLWLTAPLEQRPAAPPPHPATSLAPVLAASVTSVEVVTPEAMPTEAGTSGAKALDLGPPAWPEERLEGEPAKRLLLDYLLAARAKLADVPGYTATFRKQERLRGRLGPMQTMAMKLRHRPFSIYLKFLAPKAGKEVVYREGAYDNHVIAHNGDWTRRLVPRLKVAPNDPIALADNRHPVTDAGLANLVDRLIGYRQLDLGDPVAVTILDKVTDDEGRTWNRALHTHPHRDDDRPFARVDVHFDPATGLPRGIWSYDWPEEGREGELNLAECYIYDDVDLDATLSEADFDPANPEYAFTRF